MASRKYNVVGLGKISVSSPPKDTGDPSLRDDVSVHGPPVRSKASISLQRDKVAL